MLHCLLPSIFLWPIPLVCAPAGMSDFRQGHTPSYAQPPRPPPPRPATPRLCFRGKPFVSPRSGENRVEVMMFPSKRGGDVTVRLKSTFSQRQHLGDAQIKSAGSEGRPNTAAEWLSLALRIINPLIYDTISAEFRGSEGRVVNRGVTIYAITGYFLQSHSVNLKEIPHKNTKLGFRVFKRAYVDYTLIKKPKGKFYTFPEAQLVK